MKNALDSFPEPKVTPSNSFFCPNKSPKPKDCSFTVITDEEKQQILTFAHKRLIFWFEKWLKTIIRTETNFSRPTNHLIDAALTSGVESSPDIKTETVTWQPCCRWGGRSRVQLCARGLTQELHLKPGGAEGAALFGVLIFCLLPLLIGPCSGPSAEISLVTSYNSPLPCSWEQWCWRR